MAFVFPHLFHVLEAPVPLSISLTFSLAVLVSLSASQLPGGFLPPGLCAQLPVIPSWGHRRVLVPAHRLHVAKGERPPQTLV